MSCTEYLELEVEFVSHTTFTLLTIIFFELIQFIGIIDIIEIE